VFPRARKHNLTVRELSDETLVYDRERLKAHCLNATAALVWRFCDGNTSADDLARQLAEATGVARPAEVVGLALEQLGRRNLLDEAPQRLPPTAHVSRREALKQLARASVALPIILTIATRAAAQSASQTDASDPSSPPVNVNLSVPVNVSISGGNTRNSTPAPKIAQPPPTPCRTRGQSCLAPTSGQVGTCCAGLTCNGVSQGAGVCG